MDVIFSVLMLLYGLAGGQGEQPSAVAGIIQQAQAAKAQATQVSNPGQTPGKNAGQNGPAEYQKTDPQPNAPKVKGIYVTAHSAGGERFAKLLDLVDNSELNSMVIDIKDDYGYLTYPTTTPELLKLGEPKKYIKDLSKTVQTLQNHKVYPIARVVVFKDTVLARKRPDLSFTKSDGSVWANGKGDSFVNPYSKEVWDYNIAIAKEAAKYGFKEIQFDYVRFPEGFEKKADSLIYKKTQESRVDTVAAFVKYAKQQLEPLGIRVSVDIFGYAASVPAAEGIGQDFVKISKYVDVICPMVYPSHYTTGWFKVKDPDKNPYATIKGSMLDTHKKLDPLGVHKPAIRPWIQDFTASWLGSGHYIKYGKGEVEAQIKALQDTGVDEYLLWNASNKYTAGVNY